MDTKRAKPVPSRTRRCHDPEFKAQVIEACLQPGVSVAAVALANGLNANYLRRWVKEHRERAAGDEGEELARAGNAKSAMLVPAQVDAPVAAEAGEIRMDIRRGQIAVQMAWPVGHAATLGQWLKELLQ